MLLLCLSWTTFPFASPAAASCPSCGILHSCGKTRCAPNLVNVWAFIQGCGDVRAHLIDIWMCMFCLQGGRFRGLTMGFPPLPQCSSARRSFGRSKRLSLARSLDDLEVGVYTGSNTHSPVTCYWCLFSTSCVWATHADMLIGCTRLSPLIAVATGTGVGAVLFCGWIRLGSK